MLKEICAALLESDVNIMLVKKLRNTLQPHGHLLLADLLSFQNGIIYIDQNQFRVGFVSIHVNFIKKYEKRSVKWKKSFFFFFAHY